MPRIKSNTPVTTGPGHVFSKPVRNIRVKAQEHRRILIGSSASPTPPKGFAVELRPLTTTHDNVIASITTSSGSRHFDYFLDITNTSDRTVSAEVWQM